MPTLFRILSASLMWGYLGLAHGALAAQVRAAGAEPESGLFASTERVPVTLRTRIDWLRDTRSDKEEVPGTLTYRGLNGAEVTVPVDVRARGNFRRDKRNCNFPPLRLDLPTRKVAGTLFEGQDKLKLVTPCHDRRSAYQQYVLQEYLVYRTYGLLTPLSFGVRLVRITYEDTDEEYPFRTLTGFLIESEEAMAARNGAEISEWEQFHPGSVEDENGSQVALFQFMIGNTDWSAPYFHNVKMVRTADALYKLVPYDFDFSGVVNARYATPAEGLPIRNVRQRLFRGFCRDGVDWTALRTRFDGIRDGIQRLYDGLEELEEKERRKALEYYDDFYEINNDEKKFDRAVLRRCRRLPGGEG